MKKFALFTILILGCFQTQAQLNGRLSGDLNTYVNFYQRDSNIGAENTPLYDNFLSGGESWLGLRYSAKDFNVNLRFDGFYNSILFNPTGALNAQGIGYWNVEKYLPKIRTKVKAGYIYTQIGSGLLFRSYEDRGLLIDNALVGFSGEYNHSKHFKLKAFMGKQKFIFDQLNPVIKSINADFNYSIGSANISSGIATLNRTLDYETMNQLVGEINNLPLEERFVPTYNMYATTIYNTLYLGRVNWYIEAAYKTREAIKPFNDGPFYDSDGNVIFSTLGFTGNGWGVNGTFKRTENFVMRTSPMVNLTNAGWINWQPVVAQIRPQRLLSRYTPPALSNSEMAFAVDAFAAPNSDWDINACYTHIDFLEGEKLYREIYSEIAYRGIENWILTLGNQVLGYNQNIYQGKENPQAYPFFESLSFWTEIVRKLNKSKSLRFEIQSMFTEQDFGSWIYGLAEYNIAPHWSFAVSDMYNFDPNYNHVSRKNHYPNLFVGYTHKATRLTGQWVRQVEGINCTGGVCRYEPAFSGFKLALSTSF